MNLQDLHLLNVCYFWVSHWSLVGKLDLRV